MFLEIISFLSSLDTGFNVLNYLTVRAVFSMLTALLITLLLGKKIISKLQQYQIGQIIRSDGPESHHIKAEPQLWEVRLSFSHSLLVWLYGATGVILIYGLF
jgi:phospho-N-acetylmuramoyl-pentapeptide-transferase